MIDDETTTAQQFLLQLRAHYLDQYRDFVVEQRRNSIRGEAEVKVDLHPGTNVFRSICCADFARNDDQPEIIAFTPERALGFEPIETSLGNAALEIEGLRWDAVIIDHDSSFDPEQVIGPWFDRWFDPNDSRHVEGSEFGNVIHSVVVNPHQLRVDFGTAEPNAFWELLNLLERAGATKIRVSSVPTEAEDPKPA